jgi:hypothetical protein
MTVDDERQHLADTDTDKIPMLAEGRCPHCGFAMNTQLDRFCPRCKQAPDAPAKKAGAQVPAAFDTLMPRVANPRAGLRLVGIAIVALLACMVVAASAILNNPHRRAVAAYQAGAQRHLAGDFTGAVDDYRRALQLDDTLSAPALMAGMACAKLGAPRSDRDELQTLLERARWGDTEALQNADAWFEQAIERCDRHPEAPTGDADLGDTTRVKSLAQSLQGVTAMVRVASATDAAKPDQAESWLEVARQHCEKAQQTDPSNEQARRLLEAISSR